MFSQQSREDEMAEGLYSNRKLLQKYVAVNYNPGGYCIDSATATTLDNHIKQQIVDLKMQQDKDPFGFRLPRFSPTEVNKSQRRARFRSRSEGAINKRHDNTREASPRNLIPQSPVTINFEHGQHWINYPAVTNGDVCTYPLIDRSNQFLMAYYTYLDEQECKSDEKYKFNLRNDKENMSCKELYQHYQNLKSFGNYEAKKVSYPISQPNQSKFSSLRKFKSDDDNDSWLRSYFGIAPLHKVTFGDLLDCLDQYRKNR